ncbi:FUSC family protein [Modestobacter roseus]|uniref:Uncharacterized membrane protein YgaE (UPF0421/DUF939 family) n=1 Tax=Modestobacter roseus TaxID=1181884 RepID=A0A562IVQ2_9ACTN|nr:hypothetical protein [Modestobacter roseus]MQA35902.1 hypothetical protein [Modestobacter roseus]TWH75038.1 uncharacterized membrane protein YgaE (UPF0421/DUF939 family) [Modestobacter roseus]
MELPSRPRPGWLTRTWARHPRVGLALKAAVAAAIAWALVQLLPGPAADYPYYAPLGALLATTTSLAGSARESAQTVGAVALGAAIGLLADLVDAPNLVGIPVVIGVGVLLSGWRRLGSVRSWVPTAALFVLIFGNRDPINYVAGYVGLIMFGALIGIAVTALLPQLPLAPAQEQLARLRDVLADQLDDLADGLSGELPPTRDEWATRTHTIDPVLAQMRAAVQESDDARRGNLRARRHQQDAERQYTQARALERLTLLVEELTQLLAETERADQDQVSLGPALRPPACEALTALAAVLRSVDQDAVADPDTTRAAYDALHQLAAGLRAARRNTDEDLFAASSVVVAIRRALAAVVPRELAEQEARQQGA